MADPRHVSPATSGQVESGVLPCPRVADLIHYALGQAHGDDHRRVEMHLQGGNCGRCQSWVEQALLFRREPKIDLTLPTPGALRPAPSPSTDPTPIPESARWQRQAFLDLKKRLRLLEES